MAESYRILRFSPPEKKLEDKKKKIVTLTKKIDENKYLAYDSEEEEEVVVFDPGGADKEGIGDLENYDPTADEDVIGVGGIDEWDVGDDVVIDETPWGWGIDGLADSLSETNIELDSLTIQLDSERNDGETTFGLGANAYLQIFPSFNVMADRVADEGETLREIIVTNIGEARKIFSDNPVDITDEYIFFPNTTSAWLDYIPDGEVSYEWVGREVGTISFSGRKIKLKTSEENFAGVIKCTYKTLVDIIETTCEEETEQLVVISRWLVNSGKKVDDYTTVDFEDEGVGDVINTRDVTITVKDYCSGNVIPYATVTVAGPLIGSQVSNANADGQVTFTGLQIGGTYTIKLTKAGYQDSDDDSLNNDEFTVE